MSKPVIKGYKKLIDDLRKLDKNIQPQIGQVLAANARECVLSAQRRAPVDLGKLRQSIYSREDGPLEYRVIAAAPYAAYMEFGTGGLVEVPAELAEVAARFRGAGVRQVNIKPRPYLYPAFKQQQKVLIADLEDLIDQTTKKI